MPKLSSKPLTSLRHLRGQRNQERFKNQICSTFWWLMEARHCEAKLWVYLLVHWGGHDGADTYVQAGAVNSTALYWKMWPTRTDKGCPSSLTLMWLLQDIFTPELRCATSHCKNVFQLTFLFEKCPTVPHTFQEWKQGLDPLGQCDPELEEQL